MGQQRAEREGAEANADRFARADRLRWARRGGYPNPRRDRRSQGDPSTSTSKETAEPHVSPPSFHGAPPTTGGAPSSL